MKLNYRNHEISLKIRKGNNHVRLWYCYIDGKFAFSAYGIDEPTKVQFDRAKVIIDEIQALDGDPGEPMIGDNYLNNPNHNLEFYNPIW